jgi:hypothetical protein
VRSKGEWVEAASTKGEFKITFPADRKEWKLMGLFLGIWLIGGFITMLAVAFTNPLRRSGRSAAEIKIRERRLLKLCAWGVIAVLVTGLLTWTLALMAKV